MAAILIGTSGWSYAGWRGAFYPKDLPSRRFLELYAAVFPTTEINASFYRLPKPETFARWAEKAPDGFIFAVKANRLITHLKRLKDVEVLWDEFLRSARSLGAHLGPILLQFPPSFRFDPDRLVAFLRASGSQDVRLAFEFRHPTWMNDETSDILRRHNAALCLSDSPGYPRREAWTADFAYLRFHGRERLFTSCYSDAELAEEAAKIHRILQSGRDVLAFFNNTAEGHAVGNAKTLTKLIGRMSETP